VSDVFISYARVDGAFIARLRAALAAHDREVWVDRAWQLGARVEPASGWKLSVNEAIGRGVDSVSESVLATRSAVGTLIVAAGNGTGARASDRTHRRFLMGHPGRRHDHRLQRANNALIGGLTKDRP
jgi:hypothetical protein